MPWGNLRTGLLSDLGFTEAAELAETIHYSDTQHLAEALEGATPRDDLMAALMRTYITTPALYFVEGHKASA